MMSNRSPLDDVAWPAADFTRVPYAVFQDPRIYELELERIFYGPHWMYLGLECELPEPGDYITTTIGERPILVLRDDGRVVRAFVNRCVHRGALVVRRSRGKISELRCAYHQWCYDLKGQLIGIPQRRGVRGKGGMAADFDMRDYGLQKVRLDIYKGIIFGTFSEEVEPLEQYIGPTIREHIDRIFDRKPHVLGYFRQRIPANWKLYLENVKDPYHAGLLHLFHVTFGIYRPTMTGGTVVEPSRGHSYLLTISHDNENEGLKDLYQGTDKLREGYKLRDPSILDVKYDYDDHIHNMILSIFPTVMLGQVANTFQTRHIRPSGPNFFELYWTYLGFKDDSPSATLGKLRQANFVGPAGYISLEDGEAGRLVQCGIRGSGDQFSIVEMGGRGPIESTDHFSTEVAVRGFWANYHRVMGFTEGQRQ